MGKVLHTKGISGGGGTGTGWDGQVEFRADLPITLGTPIVGEIYLVEKKTTLLGFTTYQSGLYIRDLNNGSLSDWRRLNVKVNFTDSEFAVVSAADNSKKAKFDMSLITTSTTRNYTWQDKDLTVAGLDDLNGYVPIIGNTGNPMSGDLVMNADKRLSSLNGAFLEFDTAANRVKLKNRDDAQNQASVFIKDNNVAGMSAGNYANNVSHSTCTISETEVKFDLYSVPFAKWGRFGMYYNDAAAMVPFDYASYPVYAGLRNVTINQNVESVFCAGRDYIAKSNDGLYTNRIYLSKDNEAFELKLEHDTVTLTDKLQTFQNKDGIIALLSDISPSLRNITATDTFVTASETLNCTANTFTVNLPTAVGIQGVTYTLVNSGTGIITLDADGTETINGSLTIEIKRQYLSRTVQSDGTNWIVI